MLLYYNNLFIIINCTVIPSFTFLSVGYDYIFVNIFFNIVLIFYLLKYTNHLIAVDTLKTK